MRNNIVLLFKPHLHREITRGIFLWSVQNGGILSGRCFEGVLRISTYTRSNRKPNHHSLPNKII